MSKRDMYVLTSMINHHVENNGGCSDELKMMLHDIHLQVLNVYHDEDQYNHHQVGQLCEMLSGKYINEEEILKVVNMT